MTEVEWTPKALDLLEGLDTEAQERLVKKLDEAKDWTSHRLENLSGHLYYYRAYSSTGWETVRLPEVGALNVSDVSNVHSNLEFERESTDKPIASAMGS